MKKLLLITSTVFALLEFAHVQAQNTAANIEILFYQARSSAIEAQKAAADAIRQSELAQSTYDKDLIKKYITEAEKNLEIATNKARETSDLIENLNSLYLINFNNLNQATSATNTAIQEIQLLAADGFSNNQLDTVQRNLDRAAESANQAAQVSEQFESDKIDELSSLSESASTEVDNATNSLDRANKFQGSDLTSDTLTGFGFGPAYFLLGYDKDVLGDANDVRIRNNGTIGISSFRKDSYLGLELHYGFSFGTRCRNGYTKKEPPCNDTNLWKETSGHTVTPFLGLFDLEDGFNGYSLGVLYGFWRGDNEFKSKTALNFGIGRFVHKNQLTLAKGVTEGGAEIANFDVTDYSRKKDIYGYTIMLSAEIGF